MAAALAPYGLGLSSGDFGGVGVGGLTAAGGIGLLNRNYGLTIDRLRAAQIVLADGTVTDADHQHHPDLFWAIRGAAANFGVVTAFEFEADSVTDVGWAQFIIEADNMIAFLQRFGVAASSAPRDTTAFLTAVPAQPSQPPLAQLTVMVNNVDPDVVTDRLQPFVRLGDPAMPKQLSHPTPPLSAQSWTSLARRKANQQCGRALSTLSLPWSPEHLCACCILALSPCCKFAPSVGR
ncbi:FAD binding domain protein [Mycobacteroides abscessus subsp. bolletii 1513]|uniref:FAD binding domain protein n=1 Tax=Mycobacteroides abscessus subsp. bolletii 1513 TaxID=1299321 RepID=X8E2A5_9MYCO|nr:FAD binding domain protein [Mycobacteroides abscessus subsp. bolletii 1513]